MLKTRQTAARARQKPTFSKALLTQVFPEATKKANRMLLSGCHVNDAVALSSDHSAHETVPLETLTISTKAFINVGT